MIGSVDAPPPAPGQWPLLPPEGSSAALNPPRPADTNTGADPAESSAGAGTRRQRRLRYRYLNPPTVQVSTLRMLCCAVLSAGACYLNLIEV
eukprot:COSAG01_NODE_14407_length_1458_cov_2.484180_2_plen_92_part_00